MAIDSEFTFDERLRMSQGVASSVVVEDVLKGAIVGAVAVRRSDESADRQGTDWWVDRRCGDSLPVDAKIREKDFAVYGADKDDLALETWSVMERGVVGWTRDPGKRRDYIQWFWRDRRRWCLVPFPLLQAVFVENWQRWTREFKVSRQFTRRDGGGYHSQVVFVPRRLIWAEIYRRYCGQPG